MPRDIGSKHLSEAKYFDAVLNDGEVLSCKLLEYGNYDLLVDTETGKILLPKHAVKYLILERYED